MVTVYSSICKYIVTSICKYIVTVYVSMHGIDSERVCSKSICKYGWRISRQIKQADEMNLCEGYRMSMIVCG